MALERGQISGSTQYEKFKLITAKVVGTEKPDTPDDIQCEVGTGSSEVHNISSNTYRVLHSILDLHDFLKRNTLLEENTDVHIGIRRKFSSRTGTEQVGSDKLLLLFQDGNQSPQ